MTQTVTLARAERGVIRECHRGHDVAGVQKQVLRSLRALMSVDAAFFATADPETLLFTGAFVEDPLGPATAQFLANEFGGPDVNKFSALAVSPTHVATLDDATHHDRGVSARSRAIMQPLGLGDELRAALVVGSQCWGYLCLHRDDSPLGFTSAEAAALARLGPHIAHALRQALLLDRPAGVGDTPPPGVVLLAGDLTVAAVTAEAEALLALIRDGHSTGFPMPLPVYTVATALLALVRGHGSGSAVFPSTRVRTIDGRWVRVHASQLHGATDEDRIAVVIELVSGPTQATFLLAAYGLSAREAQVAKLVLRGASTRAIVNDLHISQHTVQDHLKAVFDKTGVHSRRELVAQLLSQGSGEDQPDAR